MLEGFVMWFDDKKGYGFIQSNNQEYFVHFREIQSNGFKTLQKGDRVNFVEGHSPKGKTANQVTKKIH